MEFEDILVEVGDSGKYQKRLMFCMMFPAAFLLPWFAMNIYLMVSVPDHWCSIPELAPFNLTMEQRQSLRPPSNASCAMYDLNYTMLFESGNFMIPNDTKTRTCGLGWDYDNTNYDETASSKWNLVCDKAHYTSLILTLTNVGSIICTPIYGALSDKIGRKPVFFVVILVTVLTGISSVLMSSFTAFIVLRTINGSLMPSIFQLPYILLLEVSGPRLRTHLNGLGNFSWTLGLCFLPLFAYLTKNWVNFGLITSSCSMLFFIYWSFLPESPRWLVSRGKYARATEVLMKIANANGKEQDPADILMKLQKYGERHKKAEHGEIESNDVLDLFRNPNIRKRFCILTFCWIANVSAYYGLQINVSNLAGNEFLNFFLLALVEVPGLIISWLFMEKVGRRWCLSGALTLTGFSCLFPVLFTVFREESPYVSVIASLVGKFGVSASFMANYQLSSELYPTTLRAIGMGTSGTFAGAAMILIPYMVFLAIYGKYIPFLIIGILCLSSGFISSFLPETLNENLPQTVLDAETFGINRKYFSWRSRKRPLCYEERSPRLLELIHERDENGGR